MDTNYTNKVTKRDSNTLQERPASKWATRCEGDDPLPYKKDVPVEPKKAVHSR